MILWAKRSIKCKAIKVLVIKEKGYVWVGEESRCLYSVEWNGGMEWWNGIVEWNSGMTTPIDHLL